MKEIDLKFVQGVWRASNVEIDCFHNISPGKEFFVEEIVREIGERLGCSYILAKVSREIVDLNCEVVGEYQKVLGENFSRDIREKNRKEIVDGFVEILGEFKVD